MSCWSTTSQVQHKNPGVGGGFWTFVPLFFWNSKNKRYVCKHTPYDIVMFFFNMSMSGKFLDAPQNWWFFMNTRPRIKNWVCRDIYARWTLQKQQMQWHLRNLFPSKSMIKRSRGIEKYQYWSNFSGCRRYFFQIHVRKRLFSPRIKYPDIGGCKILCSFHFWWLQIVKIKFS